MRDGGSVQHDGFEYNWFFRRGRWRAEVGRLSSGGWVRRRRWVRLMMRPGREREPCHGGVKHDGEGERDRSGSEVDGEQSRVDLSPYRGGSYPASVIEMDVEEDEKMIREVWKGDESDWERLRNLMRRLGTDGKKLEVWRDWLGVKAEAATEEKTGSGDVKRGKEKQKQWTEDSHVLPSEETKATMDAKGSAAEDRPSIQDVIKVVRANVRVPPPLSTYWSRSLTSFLKLFRPKTSSKHSYSPNPERNSSAS